MRWKLELDNSMTDHITSSPLGGDTPGGPSPLGFPVIEARGSLSVEPCFGGSVDVARPPSCLGQVFGGRSDPDVALGVQISVSVDQTTLDVCDILCPGQWHDPALVL